MIVDGHGRIVSYLRLSVTDRCNLRCRYCMPDGAPFLPHENILRYEELLRIMGVARTLGVRKVRLTGGEPFARLGFLEFIESARLAYPDMDLRLTTNGTLLTPALPRLKAAGVERINLSLDTLDPARFERITGRDQFEAVRGAVDACLEHGMRLKLNAVAMRGVNDDELPAFLRLAAELPLELRFIEYMPMGDDPAWSAAQVWTAEEILAEAGRLVELEPVERGLLDCGPARVFRIVGGRGSLGVISPMTNHYCATCNRLRITSTGNLRTCLYSDREYRLAPLLRNPKLGERAVRRVIEAAGAVKPLGVQLLRSRADEGGVCRTRISAIGG